MTPFTHVICSVTNYKLQAPGGRAITTRRPSTDKGGLASNDKGINIQQKMSLDHLTKVGPHHQTNSDHHHLRKVGHHKTEHWPVPICDLDKNKTMSVADLLPSAICYHQIAATTNTIGTQWSPCLMLPATRQFIETHLCAGVPPVPSNTSAHRASLPTIEAAPQQIRALLAECSTWKFDIIELERLTEKRPLVWLGMTILAR